MTDRTRRVVVTGIGAISCLGLTVEASWATALAGQSVCKAALQRELGLRSDPAVALAAMVTRLDPQKGLDLLLAGWDELLARDLQLVILGSGHPGYEQRLRELATRAPGRVAVIIGFDDALARRIYAGSDLFLMPSGYEPCGLGQLIALRYGSVPLVHATGVHEVHLSARSAVASRMSFRNEGCAMGEFTKGREYLRKQSDPALVHAARLALGGDATVGHAD